MDVPPGDVAEEIKRLQRCINDLVSLFALPAMWSGGEPSQIVHTLLDALMRMLQLDLLYIRLTESGGRAAIEMVRFAPSQEQTAQPDEFGRLLKEWLGSGRQEWPPLVRKPVGGRDISIVPLGLGLQGEIGEIVAGSERADFPRQTERLILSVAANQASIGLQGALLLSEQRRLAKAREKAEAELRERATGLEAKIRRLIDANLMGIFTWNFEGRIVEANETFLKMVQRGPEDVASAGMRWTDLTPEEWRARDELAVAELQATGTVQPYRKEYFRKDGSRVPVAVGAALFTEGGSEGVAFAVDITKQQNAEEAFQRVEAQARAIVDSALDAVVVMDAEGIVTNWNKQAEETFGWTRSEALGRRMVDTIIPAQYRLSHERGLEHFLKTGQGAVLNRRIEITARRRDGAEFPVELTITPLKSGDTWTFSSFIRDITARKQAQEDLRIAQAELAHVNRVMTMGELAASIAHEVNQPLAAILASGDSCTAWLANEPPNLEKARAAADRIVQAASQAAGIVRRIRALFKKTPSITTPVEINEVIIEAVSLVSGEAQRKGVSLSTELAANLPAVLGDRIQLQQVILNLAINGTEAMADFEDHPRQLLIQSELAERGEILVSVADTGPGIDPQQTARLFGPFFTTKPDGIGMGLSICRSIIEAHGGRLWAAANQPRGAVFHFALPTAAQDA